MCCIQYEHSYNSMFSKDSENTAAASKIHNESKLSLPITYGKLMSKQWQ